jgi:NADH dehydrogenase
VVDPTPSLLLVTGAAGFLGSHVVRAALARGYRVRASIRPSSDRAELDALSNVEAVIGDVTDVASLARAVEGIGAAVHCAATTSEGRPDLARSRAVNVEGTRALVEAASRVGRPRWIQISSMSAHPGSTSVYGRTKFEADGVVRASALPWTILRPSIIFGPGDRGVIAKSVRLMRKLPIMPVVGDGRQLLRPILAAEVAAAALDCIERPQTVGKTYAIGGSEEVTFNEFLKRLGEAAGAQRPAIHLPIGLSMLIARALGAVSANPPLTVDNVLGVKEAQRVDIAPATADFGFAPASFSEGLRRVYGESGGK